MAGQDELTRAVEIEFPYQSATGHAVSRFLTAFRDDKRIWGLKCPQCGRVVVPAQDYCESCAVDMHDWVEVGQEGVIVTWAVVRRDHALHPHPAPFAYALVRLDGADTNLLHTVLARDYASLKPGARVRAVWKDERTGHIRDLDHFALVQEA
jgi:hypothetical protein